MRLLKINDTFVDIDEKTAIGIDFQKYDIKNPGVRKINVSNSFSIPKTIKNLELFGFPDNPQTESTLVYDKFDVNYWVDNYQLIKNGSLRVEEISDRIRLYVVEKKDFWETLDQYMYCDFISDYMDWLRSEKSEYYKESLGIYSGTFDSFINRYIDNNIQDYLLFPLYLSEYYNEESGLWKEEGPPGYLTDQFPDPELRTYYFYVNGGHFVTYAKHIFEFLEYKYDVDFLRSSTDTSLIWSDTLFNSVYIPIRDIGVYHTGSGNEWYLDMRDEEILKGDECKDKSMYSLIKVLIQKFNLILDDYYENDIYYVEMRRFDDIETQAEVIDFSGNFVLEKTKMKPSIEGYGQKNTIRYETVYPDGPESSGQRVLTCQNKNLEQVKELFKIDDYFPAFLSPAFTDLSTEESINTWVILASDDVYESTSLINLNIFYDSTYNTVVDELEIASVYGLSGEYVFMNDIINYPKVYEAYKWLTINDVIDLKFFQQYFIRELGGSFFINKISGFNPDKTNQATKIELIKISDKSPDVPELLQATYVDGEDNNFVDGAGNIFI